VESLGKNQQQLTAIHTGVYRTEQKNEPRHGKTNIVRLRPAWIQTILRIRAV
jgi:hypothetical protein